MQRAAGQLRTGGMGGVIGLDMGAVLALGEASGYDRAALAVHLPYLEAGLIAGLHRRQSEAED